MRSLSFLVLLSVIPVARAEAPNPAREHFEKGTTLYDLGRYLDAAKEYEKAYELKNDPALLFNIGQAYRLGGAYADALRAYRSFLRRLPDSPNRASVSKHIATLEKLVEEQKQASASPPTTTIPPGQSNPTPEPAVEKPVVVEAATTAPTSSTKTPIYKKWWLWTAVGLAAVAIGVGVGVGVAYGGNHNAPAPAGTIPVTF